MPNDPRLKFLLKRYRKGDNLADASMDVSNVELKYLLEGCGCGDAEALARPKELGEHSLAYFATLLGTNFDRAKFDYFLHSYVRREFVSSYYKDASATFKPAPESGPPSKIPIPEGTQWISVRPKDGQENYEAY